MSLSPITNFPKGIASFGIPVLPGAPLTTGKVLFVHSGTGSNNNTGKTPSKPLATLDYAIGLCTASKGDVIFVMPGHSETVTGVGGITADVAGISIIGLGHGADMPTFLMDGAATVTLAVTAASVTLRHLRFKAGHADIVACIAATKKYLWVDDCEFVENVATENFLTEIKHTSTTNNDGDGLKVTNCRALTVDAAGLEFIELNADVDGLVVQGNFVSKDAATAAPLILCATGKDLTNCLIEWNRLVNGMTANDLFIDNDTAVNSGIVAHNRCGHHDVTTTHSLIDCDGVRLFDNLSTSIDTASGFVLPAIDADS